MDVRNRLWRGNTLTLIHASLLLLLLIAAPIAMRQSPFADLDADVEASHYDPQHGLRLVLIIAGLASATTSFCLATWESIRRGWSGKDLIVKASMASCSFSLGWAIFPYWVSGMLQTDSRLHAIAFQQAVLPGFWGAWWLLTVLILFSFVTLIQIVIIVNFDLLARTRACREGLAAFACVALVAVGFTCAPNYLRWFLD